MESENLRIQREMATLIEAYNKKIQFEIERVAKEVPKLTQPGNDGFSHMADKFVKESKRIREEITRRHNADLKPLVERLQQLSK
jgi:hypothetical protein